ILAKMVDLWGPHAAAFESVLFCGGGAKLLFPFLKAFREGSVLIADAQFANARGYLAIAEHKYGAQERPGQPATHPVLPAQANGQAVAVSSNEETRCPRRCRNNGTSFAKVVPPAKRSIPSSANNVPHARPPRS